MRDLPAQASCCSQIRTARAVAEELGPERAAARGVQRWADAREYHSERDVSRVIKEQQHGLQVEISQTELDGRTIPWIKPTAWLEFILKTGQWPRLAGLEYEERAKCEETWSLFWSNYKKLHPNFQLFQMEGLDFAKTAACFLHGDEGRTLKKAPIMVTNLQSCLGFGFADQRQSNKRRAGGDIKMCTNYAGDSFTNRHLLTIMPKTWYDKTPEFFDHSMAMLSEDLQKALEVGGDYLYWLLSPLHYRGERGLALSCQMWEVEQILQLSSEGSERARPNNRSMSPLQRWVPSIPWEQFGVRSPKWFETEGATLPWKPANAPRILDKIPYDSEHPEQFFQMDFWHSIHLGVGRTFASSVIVLCHELFPGASIPKKFEHLTECYLQFCKQEKHAPFITKISTDKVNWKKTTDMPSGCWSMGHLTSNFLLWIEDFLGQQANPPDTGLLGRSFAATKHLNRAIRMLYHCDAFLDQDVAQFTCVAFLRTTGILARDSHSAGRRLFALVPKLHSLDHFAVRLDKQSASTGIAENPLLAACQQDEDFVGKPSRLSRRVSIRSVAERTMSRYVVAARSAWVQAGMLADPK